MRPWLKYCLLLLAGLVLGIVIQRYGIVGNYIKPLFRKAQNAADGTAGFEKLSLNLDEKDWNTLLAFTDSARAQDMIPDKYKKEFAAKASYQTTKDAQCELRLKGDWADHATREKPSLRVVMGDSVAIMGIQRFSLQHPRTRNYLYEWLYKEAMREEGIIAPRYLFVTLEVNGKSYGTYAFEEHFDKILVENQKRREGPIVKFDESALWAERARHPHMKGDPTGLQSSATAPVVAFQDKLTLRDSTLSKEFLAARTLLEGFRDGKYGAAKVFDTDRMAAFFALCELLGARHGSGRWHNLRFYYNPITALLEPIAFDGDAGKEITDVFGLGSHPEDVDLFYQRLFADSTFHRVYLQKLEKVSKESYIDGLLAKKKKQLDSIQSRLHSEFVDAEFSDKVLKQNMRTICLAIHPDKCVNAYLKSQTDKDIAIEWGTVQPLAVELVGLQADSLLLKPTGRPMAQGILPGYPASYQTTVFALPKGFVRPKKMKLVYKSELGHKGKDKVLNFERTNEAFVFNTPHNGPTSIVKLLPGAGVQFEHWVDKAPDIHGAFEVIEHPLNLQFKGWHNDLYVAGFLVISDSTSTIKDYPFKNVKGRGTTIKGRNITGAFTFYGGKVIIEDCLFENITAEDAVNLVRCEFVMKNCVFRNCSSDAFDADFCKGTIVNCRVENCKNDAFDVSGSTVTFENLTVVNAGDKGISVGEGSTVTISGLQVDKATSGIGVKDKSYAKISKSTLSNCQVGVNLYQKKPEFGPANALADGITFVNCKKNIVTDKQSVLKGK